MAGEQAQRRAEALASLKLRLEAQKLKHGAVGMGAKGLREAAKKAAEAGGDNVEETEQLAFAKETEVDMEKVQVESLESQGKSSKAKFLGSTQKGSRGKAPFEGTKLGRNESPELEPQVPCGAREQR